MRPTRLDAVVSHPRAGRLIALALFAGVVCPIVARQSPTDPPARPAITGLAHAAIQVSDLAAARRFYGHLLGYPEVRGISGTHTAVFAVNARQRLIIRDGLPADRDERLLHVAFETTSALEMRTYLLARGAHAAEPAADPEAGGRSMAVTDPDGHQIRLVERDRATGEQGSGPDRRIARRILHAGLTVRDAAAADRFYKEILGFAEIWRGGRTDNVISWINMRVPDGTEYLEYMLGPGPIDRRQLGVLHHVALLVPDMQEALETVRSRLAPDDRNARATPNIGTNNRWQLNLYDHDGTRVELMEPWTVR